MDDPFHPGNKVTADVLQVELANYKRTNLLVIKGLQDDLKQKKQQTIQAVKDAQAVDDALQTALTGVTAIALASTPATGPIGPLIGVVSAMGAAGLAADNSRKKAFVQQLTSDDTGAA